MLARYVDAGLLAPIDRWFSKDELADFLPTIRQQGTIGGRLYALGAFDSAVVLYYDREMLAKAGVTPSSEAIGWTWTEFLENCGRLRAAGIEAVALHMNESADEWYTYAFSPVIWSGGGDLISSDGRRVAGVLDGEKNVHSLTEWQKVFQQSYASTDPLDPDPFGNGKVAMDWSGHWMARSHLEKKKERLGAMPLPRMGPNGVAPCGSWCFGMSARSLRPEVAAAWIKWLTDAEHGIVPIVRANGAVPARRSAFGAFPEYETTPYRLFRNQLEHAARPRPLTPVYATLTQHFAAALRDISRGADPAQRLHAAAVEIQKVIDRRNANAGGQLAREEKP
jgi:fructooligosaccharide transport system substrate-binding protein